MSISVTFTAENKKDLYAHIGAYIGSNVGAVTTTQTRVATETTHSGSTNGVTVTKNKTSKKAAKATEEESEETFELDADDAVSTDDDDTHSDEVEAEDETPEWTLSQVVAGFKEYAKSEGRDKALKILAKFKVKSVNELKETQYAKVMDLLNV